MFNFDLFLGADKLVIAEGPETAASFVGPIEAVKNEIPILASLSLSNLKNLHGLISEFWQPKKVIIAADNDKTDKNLKTLTHLKVHLEKSGIEATILTPESEEKCDWNDVLIQKGPNFIKNILKDIE